MASGDGVRSEHQTAASYGDVAGTLWMRFAYRTSPIEGRTCGSRVRDPPAKVLIPTRPKTGDEMSATSGCLIPPEDCHSQSGMKPFLPRVSQGYPPLQGGVHGP